MKYLQSLVLVLTMNFTIFSAGGPVFGDQFSVTSPLIKNSSVQFFPPTSMVNSIAFPIIYGVMSYVSAFVNTCASSVFFPEFRKNPTTDIISPSPSSLSIDWQTEEVNFSQIKNESLVVEESIISTGFEAFPPEITETPEERLRSRIKADLDSYCTQERRGSFAKRNQGSVLLSTLEDSILPLSKDVTSSEKSLVRPVLARGKSDNSYFKPSDTQELVNLFTKYPVGTWGLFCTEVSPMRGRLKSI